jgi:uncharacterized SAM-binding protein YcdF (DUF218 family)
MIKVIIIPLVVIAVIIALIGAYLAPNDLRVCDEMPTETNGCKAVDAIVAVSGGNTSLRAAEAIKLYKNGWAKYIIFSGAAQDANSPSNAEVMKAQALKSGVPASIIIVENASRNTRQNAQNTSTLLADHDIKRVIVVTSPYHQRRAGLEFKTSVNQNITVKNHPVNNDPDWPWYWWATPRGWWLAIGEIAKIGVSQAGNQG